VILSDDSDESDDDNDDNDVDGEMKWMRRIVPRSAKDKSNRKDDF
jgi:hypothetical protein